MSHANSPALCGGNNSTPAPPAPTPLTAPVPAPLSPTSLIRRLTSATERLDFAGLFPVAQPLEIELGSGDGSFLAAYAKQNPTRNFVGVERLLGRIRKLDRKGQRAGLTNLRLLSIEAGYFLKYLVPAGSVHGLHIYFPDPWPKRKHWKHRLINETFPALARSVLVPAGMVYLRTDHTDYFLQMQRVFAAASGFQSVATPEELSGVVTDFERNFNARGIATLSAAYQRVG